MAGCTRNKRRKRVNRVHRRCCIKSPFYARKLHGRALDLTVFRRSSFQTRFYSNGMNRNFSGAHEVATRCRIDRLGCCRVVHRVDRGFDEQSALCLLLHSERGPLCFDNIVQNFVGQWQPQTPVFGCCLHPLEAIQVALDARHVAAVDRIPDRLLLIDPTVTRTADQPTKAISVFSHVGYGRKPYFAQKYS